MKERKKNISISKLTSLTKTSSKTWSTKALVILHHRQTLTTIHTTIPFQWIAYIGRSCCRNQHSSCCQSNFMIQTCRCKLCIGTETYIGKELIVNWITFSCSTEMIRTGWTNSFYFFKIEQISSSIKNQLYPDKFVLSKMVNNHK